MEQPNSDDTTAIVAKDDEEMTFALNSKLGIFIECKNLPEFVLCQKETDGEVSYEQIAISDLSTNDQNRIYTVIDEENCQNATTNLITYKC